MESIEILKKRQIIKNRHQNSSKVQNKLITHKRPNDRQQYTTVYKKKHRKFRPQSINIYTSLA